jgi:anti-sigma factor RsiW
MNEMNVSKLSKQDLERLSAYVDGELDARQTAQVEARLERDELFREALAELRQTAHWLRSMPQVAPPRRFRLTPEMVERRPADRAYPFLKLASAVAVTAFVFVIGIDAFRSTHEWKALPANLAQRSAAEAPGAAADTGEAEEYAAEESMVEALEAAAPLAEPAEEATEQRFAAEAEADQQTQQPEAEMPAEESEGQPEMPLEESPAIGKTSQGADNLGGTGVEEAGGERPAEAEAAPTVTAPIENEGTLVGEEAPERGSSVRQVEPIRLLEFGLALLCIVLISATLLMRVSSR